MSAARRFKAGWAELGRLLVEVRDSGAFSEWGYPSFEAYCSTELHIRKQTAEKLLRSFTFLSRREPKVFSERARNTNEEPLEAPAFEVVEVLADADQRGQLSDAEYRRIRDSIWNPDRPASDLRRELAERFPKPEPPPPSDEVQLRRLAHTTRKLAQDLKASRAIPRGLAERARALAEELEALAKETVAA